ncbi:MAG TPA: AraC family transcriptional regulator [Candidatus Blautia gallistercoris]|uniref:AraC family transcriptional regulator n=1 Tax=Candidatus Blautia gallistercoris TaxID=2838490 RepID=A0A9D1WJ62_9FIRM|nr:AraC family transcriptional regulator [Candidatus Blautia gallistercoris]
MNLQDHDKTGYLHRPFRLFHLKDQLQRTFDYHYHDFYKIVLFLSGQVTYHIEGKTYLLQPGDILLVNRYDIHRPEISSAVPYERFIFWINEDASAFASQYGCDLFACFQKARKRGYHLIRLAPPLQTEILEQVRELEDALSSAEFGSALLSQVLFLHLLIRLNRIFLGKQYIQDQKSFSCDPVIEELMRYIHEHLTEDLSSEALARHCFLSKYHLMRKFREQTGCTLHQYVLNKRLLNARALLEQGLPATRAAAQCGFHDYTTFSRAYKKLFGSTPSSRSPLPQNTSVDE